MPSLSKEEDYRRITLDLAKPVSELECEAIRQLEAVFPRSDFFFQINERQVTLYLRQIDIRRFKEGVDQSVKRNRLDKDENILSQIVELVEAVRSYGIKSGKRLYVGYNRERKARNRKLKQTQRGIHYYALDHDFSETNNSIPNEFVNEIICGDSEHVLKGLPNNCVDIIFTSPPYNFGLDYENHRDAADWDCYFEKVFAIFRECIRVLKYGGRIIVNVQPLFSDYVPIHHIISSFFMREKLIWKAEILWEKHNYNCKYTAWGSWKSPSSPYLKYTWEFLEVFCKGVLKHNGDNTAIDITADEFKQWVYAKWDIAPERHMRDWQHPAMFPEELVTRVLKLFSFQNDLVLDPFNGVGTTTAVAKKSRRRFLGIDVSEEYCTKAVERLQQIVLQHTLFPANEQGNYGGNQ